MSLEMRSECERCHTTLRPDGDARICSHECTYCPACGDAMHGRCPNCGGELVRRPRRASRAAGPSHDADAPA
ncbi:MAG: DUF1272 domain-containing protein [Thermoplasmata archaeon]|nr:DUF1272 domain-containing protein [Thermoplasmata archaeon]